jgi:hypothetical protein
VVTTVHARSVPVSIDTKQKSFVGVDSFQIY